MQLPSAARVGAASADEMLTVDASALASRATSGVEGQRPEDSHVTDNHKGARPSGTIAEIGQCCRRPCIQAERGRDISASPLSAGWQTYRFTLTLLYCLFFWHVLAVVPALCTSYDPESTFACNTTWRLHAGDCIKRSTGLQSPPRTPPCS